MGKIKCLICGKEFIKPLGHVWQIHQMSAREYKKEFGFDLKKGIVTPEHREHLRRVIDPKAIENLKNGKKYWFKKGISNNYQRSKQTLERLKHKNIMENLDI